MNKRIRNTDGIPYFHVVHTILQCVTIALVLYLGHLVIGVVDYVHNQRPISNITADYVIINSQNEDFDVVESR